jgi:Tfp pilus assembly protein PilO
MTVENVKSGARLFISALLVAMSIAGIVFASGALNERVASVEGRTTSNTEEIKRLDEKKADKREIDDIHKQLDRIEQKLDRRK